MHQHIRGDCVMTVAIYFIIGVTVGALAWRVIVHFRQRYERRRLRAANFVLRGIAQWGRPR